MPEDTGVVSQEDAQYIIERHRLCVATDRSSHPK